MSRVLSVFMERTDKPECPCVVSAGGGYCEATEGKFPQKVTGWQGVQPRAQALPTWIAASASVKKLSHRISLWPERRWRKASCVVLVGTAHDAQKSAELPILPYMKFCYMAE